MFFLLWFLCCMLLEGLAPHSSIHCELSEVFDQEASISAWEQDILAIEQQELELDSLNKEYLFYNYEKGRGLPPSYRETGRSLQSYYDSPEQPSTQEERWKYLKRMILSDHCSQVELKRLSLEAKKEILQDVVNQPILFITIFQIITNRDILNWIQFISLNPTMIKVLYTCLFILPIQFPEQYKKLVFTHSCVDLLKRKMRRIPEFRKIFWDYFQEDMTHHQGSMTYKVLTQLGIFWIPLEVIWSKVHESPEQYRPFLNQFEKSLARYSTKDIPPYYKEANLIKANFQELKILISMTSHYPHFVKAIIKHGLQTNYTLQMLIDSDSSGDTLATWLELLDDQFFEYVKPLKLWKKCLTLPPPCAHKIYTRLNRVPKQFFPRIYHTGCASDTDTNFARMRELIQVAATHPELAHKFVLRYLPRAFLERLSQEIPLQSAFYQIFPECIPRMNCNILVEIFKNHPNEFLNLLKIMQAHNVYPEVTVSYVLDNSSIICQWVQAYPSYCEVLLQMLSCEKISPLQLEESLSKALNSKNYDAIAWLLLFLSNQKGLELPILALTKSWPPEVDCSLLDIYNSQWLTKLDKSIPQLSRLKEQLLYLVKKPSDDQLTQYLLEQGYDVDVQTLIQKDSQYTSFLVSGIPLSSQSCFLATMIVSLVQTDWNKIASLCIESQGVLYITSILLEYQHFETVKTLWSKIPPQWRRLDLRCIHRLIKQTKPEVATKVRKCLKDLAQLDTGSLSFQLASALLDTTLEKLSIVKDVHAIVPIRNIITENDNSLLLDLLTQMTLFSPPGAKETVLFLCKNHIATTKRTFQGTPLIFLLFNWNTLIPKKKKIYKLLVSEYQQSPPENNGLKLPPELALQQHTTEEFQDLIEYTSSFVSCSLRHNTEVNAKLYRTLKRKFPLDYKNQFERNILHQLAHLPGLIEPNIHKELRRRLSPEQVTQMVNQSDIDGMTPLMYAVTNPHFFKQLLQMKPDITLVDMRGLSVCHHLLARGDEKCIRNFLKYYRTLQGESVHTRSFKESSFETLYQELYQLSKKFYPFRRPFWQYAQMLTDRPTSSTENYTYLVDLLGSRNRLKVAKISYWKSLEEQSQQSSSEFKKNHQQRPPESPEFYQALMDTKTARLEDNAHKIKCGYSITDPFEVCTYYGLYVPSMKNHMLRHSSLCNGFQITFERALDILIQKTPSELPYDSWIQENKTSLMLAREYLWAWSIATLTQNSYQNSGSQIKYIPPLVQFAYHLWLFFQQQKESFSEPIQQIMCCIEVSSDYSLKWDVPTIAKVIHEEETGVLFSFVHYLPEDTAWILESELRKKYPFPEYEESFNVKRTIRMALIKTVFNTFAQGEVPRVKKYHNEVEKVHQRLEREKKPISSLKQITQDIFKISDKEFSLDDLQFHGRTASIVHNEHEYLIKVVEKGKVMRDAAIIKYLQENDENFSNGQKFDQYGTVCLGKLSPSFAEQLYERLCSRIHNSRMKRELKDLDFDVHLIEVKHPDYFRYVSDPSVSFSQLKEGVTRTMEQSFYIAERYGFWMTAFCDLAHAPDRVSMFCPEAEGNDCFFGSRLGSFDDIPGSMYPCDSSTWGLRDIGNVLNFALEPSYEYLSDNLKEYVFAYEDYMRTLGRGDELKNQQVAKAIQHSGLTCFLIPTFFLYNYLVHHAKERLEINIESWINFIEDTTFKPFQKNFLPKRRFEDFKSFYLDCIRKDLIDFQKNPRIITEVVTVQIQQGVIRDFGLQRLYAVAFLFWTQPQKRNSTILFNQQVHTSA